MACWFPKWLARNTQKSLARQCHYTHWAFSTIKIIILEQKNEYFTTSGDEPICSRLIIRRNIHSFIPFLVIQNSVASLIKESIASWPLVADFKVSGLVRKHLNILINLLISAILWVAIYNLSIIHRQLCSLTMIHWSPVFVIKTEAQYLNYKFEMFWIINLLLCKYIFLLTFPKILFEDIVLNLHCFPWVFLPLFAWVFVFRSSPETNKPLQQKLQGPF